MSNPEDQFHTIYLIECLLPNSKLGLETYKCYRETDELSNPRPAQPKEKSRFKAAFWVTFSPQQIIFSWVGIGFM